MAVPLPPHSHLAPAFREVASSLGWLASRSHLCLWFDLVAGSCGTPTVSAGQNAPWGRLGLPSLLCPLQVSRAIFQGQVHKAGERPYFIESNCILIGLDTVGPHEYIYSKFK